MDKAKNIFSSSLTKVGLVMLLLLGIGFLFLHLEEQDQAREEAAAGTESVFDETDFVVEEYTYINESSNTVYLLVVTNNSDYTVDLECNTTAYESDNTYIGISYNRIKSVEPGNSGCMLFDFDYPYAEIFEYALYYEVSEAPSGASNLSTGETVDGSSVTVECENTGSTLLKYTRADIVFLNSGSVVGYDFSYIYSADSTASIASGDTVSYTFDFDEDYDDYMVYYTCQY